MHIFESTFEKHKKLMLEAVVGGYRFDDPAPLVPGNEGLNVGRRQALRDHAIMLEKIDALVNALKIVPIPVKIKKRTYPIVSISGRKIVLVDMGNIKLPFYASTGLGGKEKVASGKWYPFFGIGPGSVGWFNKGSSQEDINNYYGSDKAKAVAQKLDSILGNLEDIIASNTIPGIHNDPQVISTINQDINPVDDAVTPEQVAAFHSNVRNILSKIDGKLIKKQKENSAIKGPITLTHNGEKILTANISTEVNNRLIKYEDSKFFDRDYQFKLEKQEDETWKLVHNQDAKNSTNVDDKEVTEPVTLSKGMKITLGKTRRFPIEVN